MPHFTPGVRGVEVDEVKHLKSLEEENARLKKLLPKPCWIKKRSRWPLGERTDDRPEAASR